MTVEHVLNVAVVGHTNTGKTSLMRTLMRDVTFGNVSDRPAVTRHVEGARIAIDGRDAIELYDTPGLEDSASLLEHLQTTNDEHIHSGIDQIHTFLNSEIAANRLAQEAKALRQVLASHVALYVIDARDRVLPKFRDELEILSRCARPVVPVLNFITTDQANTAQWRAALAELNLHAVAEFDTVVFDHLGEIRLFEKMRTLLDPFGALLDRLIDRRRAQRQELIEDSCSLIAELLVDVAAHHVRIPLADSDKKERCVEAFRNDVRQREQKCVDDLLQLHRFKEGDYDSVPLPIEDGQWGPDLFSTAALKQFSIRTGSAAAAGAATGLALDVMFGGMSLGAWTALGASVGAALGMGRTHGKRVFDRARGYSELRCDEQTQTLLLIRQTALAVALLERGHAAVSPIVFDDDHDALQSSTIRWSRPVLKMLSEAVINPSWSLMTQRSGVGLMSSRRRQIVQFIGKRIQSQFSS